MRLSPLRRYGLALVLCALASAPAAHAGDGAAPPDGSLAKLRKPWTQPPRRLDLKSYLGTLNYHAAHAPDYFRLEIRGRTPKGLPVHLAVMTDRAVPDADKDVVLLTAFHSGGERTATAGLLAFTEWLLRGSPEAREALRRNVVLMMPVGNPEGFFLWESATNSRRVDPYALSRGEKVDLKTLRPNVPDDAPEVLAYQSVADEYRPDVHLDVHGTGLHFNGHLQPPSIGRAGSNASLRSWDDRLPRRLIEAGNRAGWGYQQFDVDSQRVVYGPAMGAAQKSFCEMGTPYYTSAHYGYFRHHTLAFVMESTWCGMVVEPLKALLAEGGAGPSPVGGFPVNRVKTNYCLHLEAHGADRAARRASRVHLWERQGYFLVGSSYPETANYRLGVAAYGAEGHRLLSGALKDSGRWGQTTLGDLVKQLASLDYLDHAALGAFLAEAPPAVKKVMFEKGGFDPKAAEPALDSGLALVFQLPTDRNDLLHVAVNGRPLRPDPLDGYQTWTEDGFTYVRANLPAERARRENVWLFSCAWNPRADLAADFGYLPGSAMRDWIGRHMDDDAELKNALAIEADYRANKDKYWDK